ncbi:hypothetical protein INS49_013854 [Diaporthe citri]|uniref:uncharacterized protein n=1 Tax=Diaporthe citri TaxID=83186 RepID=UPI001C7EC7FF|nr:uncharacterized protein INS49_013854 [Diaporthe citri]KAG6357971.1 hypothetical protein INS49_013854 [Diaporthe citri]
MPRYPGGYLQVPSFDGPSDTRSQGSHHSGGGSRSHSRRTSQVSGSHVSASHPGSQAPGSAPPSNMGAPSGPVGSRPSSNVGGRSPPRGYPEPLGFDPAREPKKFGEDFNKNLDLPPEAYVQGKLDAPFTKRPGLGSVGRKINVQVNQFRVTGMPAHDIIQYDVSFSPDTGKIRPSFLNKLWNTKTVQRRLKVDDKYGPFEFKWLHDGRALAWSRNNIPEMRIRIDMDAEKNKMTRPGQDNTFTLYIRRSTRIRLVSLKSYLEGQIEWDQSVLACANFFDHLVRQFPSENMLAIKRNFYNTEQPEYKPLNRRGTVNAVKGIYAAIRMNSSMKSGGLGLGINVDVTNTAFWRGGQPFIELAENYVAMAKKEWQYFDKERICEGLKPDKYQDQVTKEYIPGMSEMFKALRRFHKCHFNVMHRGKSNDMKTYTIKQFVWEPKKFGMEGANARNYRFTMRDGTTTSVADYFLKQYNVRLFHWQWPLIETTRAGVFPMEVVIMKPWQRYNFKLDGEQTSTMIKFAVTRPPVRQNAIMQNVKSLRWVDDPYLKEFGVKINPQMQPVPARVLQNPVVQFGRKTIDPKTSGRWDLRDQVFAEPNPRPLKSWSIIVVDGCCDAATASRFGAAFADTYRRHGGKIETMQPKVFPLNMQISKVTADDIQKLYMQTGNACKGTPDLIFFVMYDKIAVPYERLKKNMEIRFATLSQMVQCAHVKKCQPQYCSNVAMKVNAKLGGYTSRLAKVQFYTVPTMVIGCDVSHGGAGSAGLTGPLASMAAITMSMDRDAIRYQAVCETNGHRVEILTPDNIKSIFPSAVRRWCQKNQRAPEHVFYFRDGVAEGQFAHVMENEVKEIRKVLEEVGRNKPKITVIVATKRHHIRFFPGSGAGDKNGNPLPGTIIEHEVTHPFHFDFYLCSHVAIQGTARPVHYHVLHDEIQYPVDKLQAMIYQQCYQYIRSTTPVSIHPAIYYAHLAAARARAHEDIAASKKDPDVRILNLMAKGLPTTEPSSFGPEEPAKPLMKIGGDEGLAQQTSIDFFKSTMWYI